MLGMLIGLLSGMLMSIQGVFNAEVTKQAGVWVAAGFVQITAFVICVAAWFVTGKEGSISGIVQVKPWYMLLGGVIDVYKRQADESLQDQSPSEAVEELSFRKASDVASKPEYSDCYILGACLLYTSSIPEV